MGKAESVQDLSCLRPMSWDGGAPGLSCWPPSAQVALALGRGHLAALEGGWRQKEQSLTVPLVGVGNTVTFRSSPAQPGEGGGPGVLCTSDLG